MTEKTTNKTKAKATAKKSKAKAVAKKAEAKKTVAKAPKVAKATTKAPKMAKKDLANDTEVLAIKEKMLEATRQEQYLENIMWVNDEKQVIEPSEYQVIHMEVQDIKAEINKDYRNLSKDKKEFIQNLIDQESEEGEDKTIFNYNPERVRQVLKDDILEYDMEILNNIDLDIDEIKSTENEHIYNTRILSMAVQYNRLTPVGKEILYLKAENSTEESFSIAMIEEIKDIDIEKEFSFRQETSNQNQRNHKNNRTARNQNKKKSYRQNGSGRNQNSGYHRERDTGGESYHGRTY